MIKLVRKYLRRHVGANAKGIFRNSQCVIALILACVVVSLSRLEANFFSYSTISLLISYNFMALGFTITGLAVVFALPNQTYIRFLAEAEESRASSGIKRVSAWQRILFILSWNGFCHFVALIVMLGVLLGSFSKQELVVAPTWAPNLLIALANGVVVTIQGYALLQFLSTLLSAFLFCNTYAYVTLGQERQKIRAERRAAND